MKTIGILSLILAACSSPRAWAVSAGNYLLASDWANDQIVRFDATTGAFVDVFIPSGRGSLDNPADLAIGPSGDLFVASGANNRILRYDGQTGSFLGTAAFNVPTPIGMEFGSDGLLYVAARGSNSIVKVNVAQGTVVLVGLDAGRSIEMPRGHLT